MSQVRKRCREHGAASAFLKSPRSLNARLVRSTVFSEKQKDYIALAELTGLGSGAILKKHLLPHVLGNVSVLATLDIGKTVLMNIGQGSNH